MALKLTNNQYVKLNIDGSYIIYENDSARTTEKTSTNVKTVILKYQEIINKLKSDQERCYYDPSFLNEIQKWEDEYDRYIKAYINKDLTQKFPLIKKHIKDINQTIPKIIQRGVIGVSANSVEEVYNKIKRYKIFGETEDV